MIDVYIEDETGKFPEELKKIIIDVANKAAEEEGCYTIQWDVDSLDWKNLGKQNILDRVLSKTKNGSIILMHNGTQDTANVLDEMLKKLKEKGFKFVPTSEFIYRENFTIDHAGKQIKN